MDFLFGSELAEKAKEIQIFIVPTNSQITQWLKETKGKVDKELSIYLNLKYISDFVYIGDLSLQQRAYIFQELQN